MRDLNEPLNNGQNSRAKFKQRIAGGAVLLIVLAIFLPFIFNHSHMGATTAPATDASPPPAASVQVGTADQAQTQAQAQTQTQAQAQAQAQVVQPPAPAQTQPTLNTSAAPAAPEAQQSPNNPGDQSMRSDQPGLTSPQSESSEPGPQQSVQQPSSVAAAPTQQIQPNQPEQSTTNQPAEQQLSTPETQAAPPTPAVSAKSTPSVAVKAKPVHVAAAAHAAAHHPLPTPVKTAAKAPVMPHGDWMVQVGSFSQADYANKLAVKLRSRGFPVYTQRGPNHLVRVYVGPLADQQQANKIRQKVAAEFQLNGFVSQKHV